MVGEIKIRTAILLDLQNKKLNAWKSVLDEVVNSINLNKKESKADMFKSFFIATERANFPQLPKFFKYNINEECRVDLTPEQRRAMNYKYSLYPGPGPGGGCVKRAQFFKQRFFCCRKSCQRNGQDFSSSRVATQRNVSSFLHNFGSQKQGKLKKISFYLAKGHVFSTRISKHTFMLSLVLCRKTRGDRCLKRMTRLLRLVLQRKVFVLVNIPNTDVKMKQAWLGQNYNQGSIGSILNTEICSANQHRGDPPRICDDHSIQIFLHFFL